MMCLMVAVLPIKCIQQLKAAETVFWFRIRGAGESVEIELERLLSKPALFRADVS